MITRPVHVVPTPEECAAEFANAGSDWQARFLNALAEHAFWPEQLDYLTVDPALTPGARALMELIGVYAYSSKGGRREDISASTLLQASPRRGYDLPALASEGRALVKDLEARTRGMEGP